MDWPSKPFFFNRRQHRPSAAPSVCRQYVVVVVHAVHVPKMVRPTLDTRALCLLVGCSDALPATRPDDLGCGLSRRGRTSRRLACRPAKRTGCVHGALCGVLCAAAAAAGAMLIAIAPLLRAASASPPPLPSLCIAAASRCCCYSPSAVQQDVQGEEDSRKEAAPESPHPAGEKRRQQKQGAGAQTDGRRMNSLRRRRRHSLTLNRSARVCAPPVDPSPHG